MEKPGKALLGKPVRLIKQQQQIPLDSESKSAEQPAEATTVLNSSGNDRKVQDETYRLTSRMRVITPTPPILEPNMVGNHISTEDELQKTKTKLAVGSLTSIPTWEEIQQRKGTHGKIEAMTDKKSRNHNREGLGMREVNAPSSAQQNQAYTSQSNEKKTSSIETNGLPEPPPFMIPRAEENRPHQHHSQVGAPIGANPMSHLSMAEEGNHESICHIGGVRYRLIKKIGQGGMSTVFCALNENNPNDRDSLVAIKCVRGSENVQALKEEVNLLMKLKGNPYVVQYIAHDLSALSYGVLAMELGQNDVSQCLSELSMNKDTGKRDLTVRSRNTIRYLFEGMVEAVNAIHDYKIVHGDLKPANFLIIKGRIKLIDFGIAKTIGDNTINITRDNQTGTINYIPPEALRMNANNQYKLSYKADVWSLGCILYSMVYGQPPFHHIVALAPKIAAIMSMDHEIAYPALPTNDQPVIDLIRRCLQRDVEKRIGIPGAHGILAHPFLNPSASPPPLQSGISKNLLYHVVHELTARASEVHHTVGSAAFLANKFAQDVVGNVLKSGNVGDSVTYAMNSMADAGFHRKALASAVPATCEMHDKENLPRAGLRVIY